MIFPPEVRESAVSREYRWPRLADAMNRVEWGFGLRVVKQDPVRDALVRIGDTTGETDATIILNKVTKTVHDATAAVEATSESIAGAIAANRRPGTFHQQLAWLLRQAPLRSLGIVFVVGFVIT
jgi:hypothetical protein